MGEGGLRDARRRLGRDQLRGDARAGVLQGRTVRGLHGLLRHDHAAGRALLRAARPATGAGSDRPGRGPQAGAQPAALHLEAGRHGASPRRGRRERSRRRERHRRHADRRGADPLPARRRRRRRRCRDLAGRDRPGDDHPPAEGSGDPGPVRRADAVPDRAPLLRREPGRQALRGDADQDGAAAHDARFRILRAQPAHGGLGGGRERVHHRRARRRAPRCGRSRPAAWASTSSRRWSSCPPWPSSARAWCATPRASTPTPCTRPPPAPCS